MAGTTAGRADFPAPDIPEGLFKKKARRVERLALWKGSPRGKARRVERRAASKGAPRGKARRVAGTTAWRVQQRGGSGVVVMSRLV